MDAWRAAAGARLACDSGSVAAILRVCATGLILHGGGQALVHTWLARSLSRGWCGDRGLGETRRAPSVPACLDRWEEQATLSDLGPPTTGALPAAAGRGRPGRAAHSVLDYSASLTAVGGLYYADLRRYVAQRC